jgi:uncharacterized coiled-coil DUF342 family protein
VKDKLINRIDELSQMIGELVEKREYSISELRRLEAEIDSVSMVIFELKSLVDTDEAQ